MALNSKKLNEVLDNMKAINDEATNADSTFRNIGNQLKNLARDSKTYKGEIEGASAANTRLISSAKTLSQITKDDLRDKEKMKKFDKAREKLLSNRASLESKIRTLSEKALKLESSRSKTARANAKDLWKTVGLLKDSNDWTEGLLENYEGVVKANDELNKNTKFFDKMGETLKTIPGIGPLISGPFEKAGKAMRDARINKDGFLKSAGKGVLELSKAFGPAYLLGSIIKADSHMVEMQRSLQLSQEEASRLHHHPRKTRFTLRPHLL